MIITTHMSQLLLLKTSIQFHELLQDCYRKNDIILSDSIVPQIGSSMGTIKKGRKYSKEGGNVVDVCFD